MVGASESGGGNAQAHPAEGTAQTSYAPRLESEDVASSGITSRTAYAYVLQRGYAPADHFHLGSCYLHNITPEAVEALTKERSEEVGPSSVNGSLRTLRRALHLAEEWKLITKALQAYVLRTAG